MILLGVNIDHCATLRQARYREAAGAEGLFVEPDPVQVALHSEKAGADGITAHLREDRRHIQDRDIWRLKESISTRLNLEMACTPPMLAIALRVRPRAACVVPENRSEVTTEGGLDVAGARAAVGDCVKALSDAGIEASLFIDPDPRQIEVAAELGAPVVELHTGAYSNAYPTPRRAAEFARLRDGAALAARVGLKVNAGHGINYVNISEVRTIPGLNELNIGHSIMSRALFTGIDEAVREMKERMNP
ncbi:MAG TPA: pyridoxine 5'-phosphate synthase [Opitutaceae bacterium]|jgi:pyridoxine 5-phosphate synthase